MAPPSASPKNSGGRCPFPPGGGGGGGGGTAFASLSSCGPEQPGSCRSTRPSPSSSLPFEHSGGGGLYSLPPAGATSALSSSRGSSSSCLPRRRRISLASER